MYFIVGRDKKSKVNWEEFFFIGCRWKKKRLDLIIALISCQKYE